MAETNWATIRRLRSAFVEISTALNESLQDPGSNAAARLQRARALLDGIDVAAPPPSDEIEAQPGAGSWRIGRVLAHIDANLKRPLRNEELAAVARLSTFYFAVAFRNSVGSSPHAYVIRRRLERAQTLMLSTDRTLSDIAVDCGLADQSHFTRLFHRLFGQSPAAWRRARASPESLMRRAASRRRGLPVPERAGRAALPHAGAVRYSGNGADISRSTVDGGL